ncbi:MAG: hypothetical protein OEY26_03435 [Nitrospinota bacterium]|nr:hypothetical protein [Nitrospinota bacterium]
MAHHVELCELRQIVNRTADFIGRQECLRIDVGNRTVRQGISFAAGRAEVEQSRFVADQTFGAGAWNGVLSHRKVTSV